MSRNYWEEVYQSKQADQVSWYQQQPSQTLTFIESLNLPLDAKLIDVGSGASLLIDHLLEAGYQYLHVLDLSETALDITRARLTAKSLDSRHVHWLVADVCTVALASQFFDVWHDRAVFHFMLTEGQQEQYLHNVRQTLKPSGYLILSTFAEDGPTQCSGLMVERYSLAKLSHKLDKDFILLRHEFELHITPWGTEQKFLNTIWQFRN
ncbi:MULTISPECIES: methyltransferase domain-containing protein [Acinetobacter]|uniref:methyltransferase domain-containing protein n=1 Tax=Acinetobacter TaxID=469 RepID=UPI002676A2C5|nr:methyltransferase domain-containing protein [Acinetobacter higginsii]MDO3665502.1 methyltransferase domain-containing protein [Acinetobacter higginsii]